MLVFAFKIEPVEDKGLIETIQAITEGTEDFLTGFFGANIFASLFTGGLLQFIWGMVNTLQIVVLTALFQVKIPLNADIPMMMILRLCGLDTLIVSEEIFSLFNFRETESFNTVTYTDGT